MNLFEKSINVPVLAVIIVVLFSQRFLLTLLPETQEVKQRFLRVRMQPQNLIKFSKASELGTYAEMIKTLGTPDLKHK